MSLTELYCGREVEPIDNTNVMLGESLARQHQLARIIGETFTKHEAQPVYRAGTLGARLALRQVINN